MDEKPCMPKKCIYLYGKRYIEMKTQKNTDKKPVAMTKKNHSTQHLQTLEETATRHKHNIDE